MTEPTLCSNCRHVRLTFKNDSPWRWVCHKHPRLAGWGWVTDRMLNLPPFLFCKDVNGGACPIYEAGDNQLSQLIEEFDQ